MKTAWTVGKRGVFHTYIWICTSGGRLVVSDKVKWHEDLGVSYMGSYRGLAVLNTKNKTGYILSYEQGMGHSDAQFIPENVWRALEQEFPGYTLTEKKGMAEAVEKDWAAASADNKYKNYFLRGLRTPIPDTYKQYAALKEASDNEIFTYFGMRFDIDLAERLIASSPHQTRVAPRAFLESFVDTSEDTPDDNGVMHLDITKVYVNKEHMQNVDITKPGIVAVVVAKADPKRNLPEKPFSVLIDGNHRAAKALQENKEFSVHILTPEETWKVMENATYPGLLKNYVNPTKKPAKPRVKKPTVVELKEGDKVRYNGQEAVVDDIRGTVIGIKTQDGGYQRVNKEQLTKIAMTQPGGAPYSAKEVARNTDTNITELDAAWYELKIVFNKEKGPVWAYVPLGLDTTPHAVIPLTAAKPESKSKQEYTSEGTSVNQLPGVFRRVEWKPKSVNLDYGGGRFDQAADFLKDKGVKNLVFDPYNRAAEHNKQIMQLLKKRKADTATIANVLNVIKEPEIRKQVLRKVRSLVKPGGAVYISCYRGKGGPQGIPTSRGWQENRPLRTYLEEIESVFSSAELVGSMIIARV